MSEENVELAGTAPPGWYPHPERPEEEWYWDGRAWTESRWASKPRPPKRANLDRAAFSRGKFRVAFDGHWQEEFDTLADAVEWAQEVSQTGRTTWVVERRPFSLRFQAAFPMEHADEAKKEWKRRNNWRSVIASFGAGFGG
jgi:hypothetical protein